MFELSVKDHFSAAHKIEGYNGACANVHGHNYGVEIFVSCSRLNKIGIAIDLKTLKNYLRNTIASFDHADLNKHPYFEKAKVNPTSENLAKYVFEEMHKALKKENAQLIKVIISESEGSAVTYTPAPNK